MGEASKRESVHRWPAKHVLDLDLDFFQDGVATDRRPDGPRLDGAEYPPWPLERVLAFLEERCGVRDALPGIVVEHHGELFDHWRRLITSGTLDSRLDLTHADGHADLGDGDSSYSYLMDTLLHLEPAERVDPRRGLNGLNDGSYLAFAIACRWISSLTYVYIDGGGGGVYPFFKQGLDKNATAIQLAATAAGEVRNAVDFAFGLPGKKFPKIDRLEPPVPFREVHASEFWADREFDLICLARSPGFTPAESDENFDEIRRRFIDDGRPPFTGPPSVRVRGRYPLAR